MKDQSTRGQRKRINQEKIGKVASALAHLEQEPTLAKVREQLGFTGSQTTLQKYLKAWRLECFKAYKTRSSALVESSELATLQSKNQELKTNLAQLEEHSRIVASEFARTERKNVQLTQQLAQLTTQIQELTEERDQLKAAQGHAEQLYNELKAERAVLLERMASDKDQLIASLREELHQIHTTSFQALRELGSQSDEALMQEKIKVIHQEDRNRSLTEQVAKLQAEVSSAYQLVSPLKLRIQQLEQLQSDQSEVPEERC